MASHPSHAARSAGPRASAKVRMPSANWPTDCTSSKAWRKAPAMPLFHWACSLSMLPAFKKNIEKSADRAPSTLRRSPAKQMQKFLGVSKGQEGRADSKSLAACAKFRPQSPFLYSASNWLRSCSASVNASQTLVSILETSSFSDGSKHAEVIRFKLTPIPLRVGGVGATGASHWRQIVGAHSLWLRTSSRGAMDREMPLVSSDVRKGAGPINSLMREPSSERITSAARIDISFGGTAPRLFSKTHRSALAGTRCINCKTMMPIISLAVVLAFTRVRRPSSPWTPQPISISSGGMGRRLGWPGILHDVKQTPWVRTTSAIA
mmetsp:Transcript_129507/g.322818  ORF Transcript_129507/g.322818 Transcript_129507/m.322818 type:complete len:321 (+) Transcript_129507:1915-2877(+)